MSDDAKVPGELRLGRPEDALDVLMRHSGDCVKIVDLDGRVLRWNPACEEVLGWMARDVLGTKLPDVPEADRLSTIRAVRAAAAEGKVAEREYDALRADGTLVSMRMVVVPLVDADGDPAAVMAISREVLSDERLDRQREEFSAFVGKGLSGPLNTIITASELLSRPNIVTDRSRSVQLARLIREKSRDASALVDDLLLTSQLAAGELVLNREPANLATLVTGAVQRVPGGPQKVLLEFGDLPEFALVDAARVERAVAILLKTACDRAPEGSQVRVSVYRHGAVVAVEFHSEGETVDPEDLERVFDRYHPGGALGAATDAGIGLHLARCIAAAHGGVVYARSSEDAAVVLVMVLPIAE